MMRFMLHLILRYCIAWTVCAALGRRGGLSAKRNPPERVVLGYRCVSQLLRFAAFQN
jgi:hypothetical protein